jgi:hypothetical protein
MCIGRGLKPSTEGISFTGLRRSILGTPYELAHESRMYGWIRWNHPRGTSLNAQCKLPQRREPGVIHVGKVAPLKNDYRRRRKGFFSSSHWIGKSGLLTLLKQWTTERYELDHCDFGGRPPLSFAAESGQERTVKQLLDTGKVDVDSRDNDGRTPLSYAAWLGKKSNSREEARRQPSVRVRAQRRDSAIRAVALQFVC